MKKISVCVFVILIIGVPLQVYMFSQKIWDGLEVLIFVSHPLMLLVGSLLTISGWRELQKVRKYVAMLECELAQRRQQQTS